MPWSSVNTWATASGTWLTADNSVGSLSQGQTATVVGKQTVSGPASLTGAITAVAAGAVTITGAASAGQSATSTVSAKETISGISASTGVGGSNAAAGSESLSVVGALAQGQTSSAAGKETVSGLAVGQAAQTLTAAGSVTTSGTKTAGQVSSVLAVARESITGAATASAVGGAASAAGSQTFGSAGNASQGQSVLALGTSTTSGTASSASAQSSSGVGASYLKAGYVSQAQTLVAAGSVSLAGTAAVGQSAQTSSILSSETMWGTGSSSGVQKSVGAGTQTLSPGVLSQVQGSFGVGSITVLGSAGAGFGAQTISAAGALSVQGVARGDQAQFWQALAAETISGGLSAFQAGSAAAAAVETIGSSAELSGRQSVIGGGSVSVDGVAASRSASSASSVAQITIFGGAPIAQPGWSDTLTWDGSSSDWLGMINQQDQTASGSGWMYFAVTGELSSAQSMDGNGSVAIIGGSAVEFCAGSSLAFGSAAILGSGDAGSFSASSGLGTEVVTGSAEAGSGSSSFAQGVETVSASGSLSQMAQTSDGTLSLVFGLTGAVQQDRSTVDAVGGITIRGAATVSHAQAVMGGLHEFIFSSAACSSQAQSVEVSAVEVIASQDGSGSQTESAAGSGYLEITGLAVCAGGQTSGGFGYQKLDGESARGYLRRLLRYPHNAVFDKSPKGMRVIEWSLGDELSWAIADDLLKVTTDGVTRWFSLEGNTVESLAHALRASGIEISVTGSAYPFAADILLDDGARLGWDNALGFSSVLWVLFYAYAHELADLSFQVEQALRQMVIWQAEGEWLDLWGQIYGVPRKQGERDSVYAKRIPEEVFRPRVNALAIEKAILDQTGYDVRILEPWQEIFTLDESVLSGPHKVYDGARTGYHLIQPVTRQAVDWDVVMRIIYRNKPAGVIVLAPKYISSSEVTYHGGAVVAGRLRSHVDVLRYGDFASLDDSLILDDTGFAGFSSGSRHRIERRKSSAVLAAPKRWEDFSWSSQRTWGAEYVIDSKTSREPVGS